MTLTVFDNDGQMVRPETIRAIARGGNLSFDAQAFFGFSGSTQGYVRIASSSGAKLLGNVVFGDRDPTRDRLGFGASLPLSNGGSTAFLFSQVAQAPGFYTGIALLALEEEET